MYSTVGRFISNIYDQCSLHWYNKYTSLLTLLSVVVHIPGSVTPQSVKIPLMSGKLYNKDINLCTVYSKVQACTYISMQ